MNEKSIIEKYNTGYETVISIDFLLLFLSQQMIPQSDLLVVYLLTFWFPTDQKSCNIPNCAGNKKTEWKWSIKTRRISSTSMLLRSKIYLVASNMPQRGRLTSNDFSESLEILCWSTNITTSPEKNWKYISWLLILIINRILKMYQLVQKIKKKNCFFR